MMRAHIAMYRFALMIGLAFNYMIFTMQAVCGDDSGSNGDDTDDNAGACSMEMKFYPSCDDQVTIASATIYADGQCHTVETDLSPSDTNYSLLPGNYRVECASDGTLYFLDSACEDGTCSQSGSCVSDETMAGSLFEVVTGQSVRDPAVVDSYCELLYNDQHEIFVVVLGDCSRPGCSVDGSINPSVPSESTPTTQPTGMSVPQQPPTDRPISPPQQQPQPTRRPIAPTNAPRAEPVPVPSAMPAPLPIPATPAPITLAPIFKNTTSLSPISSTPISLPITIAPVRSPVPVPTASPVMVDIPTMSPMKMPTLSPTKSATPSASPVSQNDPTISPNANVRSPTVRVQPTAPTPTNNSTVTQSSSNDNSFVLLGAIGGSITVIAMLMILFLLRKQCRQRATSANSKNGALASTTSSEKSKTLQLGNELNNHDRLVAATATNEIWFDPNRDDVSTLDGGTLPDMALNAGGDEPTASVNMDFDYNKNRYRSSGTVDEHSRFTSSTNPTAFTSLSKLGFRSTTSSLFDRNNDDQSFDQQFADLDDEEIMTAVGSMNWSRTQSNTGNNTAEMNDIANRIRPFEVMVPPGMLGLVIDAPNGSVPVIRFIKPTSVLYPQVQVGDRLISVDQQNVTNMSAQQVSQLITEKQNQNRIFVLCRLVLPVAPEPQIQQRS